MPTSYLSIGDTTIVSYLRFAGIPVSLGSKTFLIEEPDYDITGHTIYSYKEYPVYIVGMSWKRLYKVIKKLRG